MSKRTFKSQASSGRAGNALGAFGGSAFGTGETSILSYIQEPLDYSTIANANIVVALKNLSKKDDTTKAKALEDLQGFVSSPDTEIEDGLLDAWTKQFPRLSIDNSRRVRQLALVLNGQVCAKAGKRTAKHLPRIAGPWLAGTFDSDRTVSRLASDAIALVFPTTEKVQGLRKAFQKSIIEYARDATLHETVHTLSDERVVSVDDAQATYARIVATGLSLITSLLNELDAETVEKEIYTYEEVFRDIRIWEFVNYADPSVRRSMHRLVQACLDKRFDLLQPSGKAISNAYIYKGLQADQTGSAFDFIQTLESLTTTMPTLWTDSYSGKKPAVSRLHHFLKGGSQSAPVTFWNVLGQTLQTIPSEILPSDVEDIATLLSAARAGVTKKDERFNASSAWPVYFSLTARLTSRLPQIKAESVLDTQVMPLFRQYIFPESDNAEWNLSGISKASSIIANAVAINQTTPLLIREWPLLSAKLTETAKMSQPEQSQQFDKSQRHVATTGERWADLQREFWSKSSDEKLHLTFTSTSTSLLQTCIELLRSRNGKPYGAAAIIEQILRTSGQHLMKDETFRDTIITFATNDVPEMMFSPSQRHLLSALHFIVPQEELSSACTAILTSVLDSDELQNAKVDALRIVFADNAPEEMIRIAKTSPQLGMFLDGSLRSLDLAKIGSLIAHMIKLGALSDNTTDAMLSSMTNNLTVSSEPAILLPTIETLSQISPSVINSYGGQSDASASQILPNLLRLEQAPDHEVAQKAGQLAASLSIAVNGEAGRSKYDVILRNLDDTSGTHLPVATLVEWALRLIGAEGKVDHPADLLPSMETWLAAVRSAIRRPDNSLALLSPLGGVIYSLSSTKSDHGAKIPISEEGFSQALRIAVYVTRLLTETDMAEHLGSAKVEILTILHLVSLATEDNISVYGTNDLFRWPKPATLVAHREADILDFISQANTLLSTWWSTLIPQIDQESSASLPFSQFTSTLEQIRNAEEPLSAVSYYTWTSYAQTLSNGFELHGSSHTQISASEALLKQRRSDKQLLALAATVSGLQQPLAGTQTLSRYTNELVSDLTDLKIGSDEHRALDQIVLLNLILHTQEDIASAVAKQRLVFLMKALLRRLNESKKVVVKAEACKALAALLPAVHDIYGEHWEQILSFLVEWWCSDATDGGSEEDDGTKVLLTNASLKLLGTLKTLSKAEEPNDDLLDALKDSADRVREGLLQLLVSAGESNDESNQPLMITHELLARQLAALPPKPLKQAEDLYPLLYSSSRPIMQAAFEMLHIHIPEAQEQISFDAALDNKAAQLPDELLSLVLEAPTLDSLADASFDRMMPLSLQGYLYSWRLIFDHFNGSSFRVKNDYIEQLKEGGYLTGLLDLTFDFLGHSRGKPVDVSRFDVETYLPDSEPVPEKDVQWLLTHLYSLALRHLPSLVKGYYLDLRSRQTSLAVESWTAKYLSPLLISSALQGVEEWAEKSVKEDPEYEKMAIKVGMRSKEVYVSYVVDEQTMAIKVVLPDAYPLASAQVVGVSRVAVKEEKWQSWLRNCQGVITFSNGSIIDGLAAWRKNVTGALKGQTECAICYSIISADKQLPTKRCPTCKNLFHSSCLLKWFKTSNASTCPLCRNPFNFN